MSRRILQIRRACFVALATAALSGAGGGCRLWDLYEDEPFPEEVQEMTKGVRPAEPGSRPIATSEKGRQVEQNLGYGRGK